MWGCLKEDHAQMSSCRKKNAPRIHGFHWMQPVELLMSCYVSSPLPLSTSIFTFKTNASYIQKRHFQRRGNIAEKLRKGSKKFLVYVYFLLKEWKWSVTLVDVWKETVQHLHHNLESFSHLNNMSFLCFHLLSNHRFRKLCTEMWTEQPNSAVLCLHAGNLLIW